MNTPARPPLRLLLAGAGQIGRAHAERIAREPGCELVGVVDPAAAAAAWAQSHGWPCHASLDAALQALRPDGAVLATPNAEHVNGALACLAQWVPVLVEKPVADTLVDAQRLAAAEAQAHGSVPVLVGHHRRHSAVLEAAREVIASGRLGRLVTVRASATFRKPEHYFTEAPWRAQPGGGPVLINLVHEVDSLRFLLGEIVEVQAMASNAARGLAVEDSVVVGLRFASGVLGSLLLSDTAASPHSWEQTSGENPRYDHHADEDCYVIAGDRGSLQLPTMRLRCYPGEPSWWAPLHTETLAVAPRDPLQAQLQHFCAVLRGEAAPRVTAADAARTLAVTLAIAEAAATRQPMRLAA